MGLQFALTICCDASGVCKFGGESLLFLKVLLPFPEIILFFAAASLRRAS